MEEMMQIIRELDWSPLFISLKTGVVATIISFFLGIFAARKVVKASPGKKAVIDGILTLPMSPHCLCSLFLYRSAFPCPFRSTDRMPEDDSLPEISVAAASRALLWASTLSTYARSARSPALSGFLSRGKVMMPS